MTSTALQSTELDHLAQLVENEKCALVLGPLASCDAVGKPLRGLLANHIADDFFQKTGQRLPEPDNLSLVCTAFLKSPALSRSSLELLVRDFYKKYDQPPPLLRMAARLPFPLILTTAPDAMLQNAFLLEKKRHFFPGVYRFSRTQTDDFDLKPADQTYLYQLFGKIDDTGKCDSMVLGTDDQLKYIDSVQGVGDETRLHKSLRRAMQKDFEAFLFVGFDFENWYLRVLFHILEVAASDKVKFIYGFPEGLSRNFSTESEAFFRQQYRFKFLKDEPTEVFRQLISRLETGKPNAASSETEQRTLLFLHSNHPQDEAARDRIDKHLASAKRAHGIRSVGIHDFEAGNEAANRLKKINAASVIVVLFSTDFDADDDLVELAEIARQRQSSSVVVTAIYVQEALGALDFFKKGWFVFPSPATSLSLNFDGETGAKSSAAFLEKLIQTLPKP